MSEQNKKIVSVEILHLEECGYGPEGKHTRREWREECKKFFTSDRDTFHSWQIAVTSKSPSNLKGYGVKVVYENQESSILNDHQQEFCFDLVANYFEFDFDAFKNYEFHHHVNFTFSKFLFDIEFYSCRFQKKLDLEHTDFLQSLEFQNCQFQELNLGNSIINSFFQISNSTIQKSTDIYNSRMRGILCVNTVFEGFVSFLNTQIYGMAHFDNSSFYQIYFDNSTFHLGAVFKKAKFYNVSSFRFVNFLDSTDFENAEFNCVGHFEGATFNSNSSRIPTFRGCKIDSTRLEFSDESHFTKNDFTEDAIKNISFLKRLADEHGQIDQALNFNAMELRAKRKLAFDSLKPSRHPDSVFLQKHSSWRFWVLFSGFFKGQFWFWLFTLLYEKFSDFGRSYTRPLFLLLALDLMTFLLCICIVSQQGGELEKTLYASLNEAKAYGEKVEIRITAFRAASEYSIYKTGNFLDFSDTDNHTEIINQRLFGSGIEPSCMRFYSFWKDLFSAIFVFLIGLGLRNKYRVS